MHKLTDVEKAIWKKLVESRFCPDGREYHSIEEWCVTATCQECLCYFVRFGDAPKEISDSQKALGLFVEASGLFGDADRFDQGVCASLYALYQMQGQCEAESLAEELGYTESLLEIATRVGDAVFIEALGSDRANEARVDENSLEDHISKTLDLP